MRYRTAQNYATRFRRAWVVFLGEIRTAVGLPHTITEARALPLRSLVYRTARPLALGYVAIIAACLLLGIPLWEGK